ncbi:hypothetical protein J1N35_009665 [Gossypium stocksii]|uniref:Reverse transcriptase n=1 Tax=Gossypium stocksii TaxID=47602 RepID=A0A9D4A9T4_9ROSI|nr:hypothetical protein J1N35_009665 [Gossypium stocksii]
MENHDYEHHKIQLAILFVDSLHALLAKTNTTGIYMNRFQHNCIFKQRSNNFSFCFIPTTEANDCVLLGEVTVNGAIVLKDVLQEYERCSGQCVNFSKSTIFYSSNTVEEEKGKVSSLLGVRRSSNPEKYLGLPNMVGRKKKESFQNLLDSVAVRIDGWSSRQYQLLLCHASFYLISMSCFLLPNLLCGNIESVFAKFWWQKGFGKRGTHWCQWSYLCRPKDEGGIGFRNMAQFNLALLEKQGWRLVINPNSLVAQVFKLNIFQKMIFLTRDWGIRARIHGLVYGRLRAYWRRV